MIGIYKITNLLNNKAYIGQSVHIERRWVEHCKPSAKSLIGIAIKDFGKENFSFEVLEELSIEDIDLLDEREMYYIHKYNTLTPEGYNVSEYTGVQHTTFVTLSKKDYNDIIKLLQSTDKTFQEIADEFQVNKRTISRINNGYTHKMENLIYPIRKSEHGVSPLYKSEEKKEYFCIECGAKVTKGATRCSKCSRISLRIVKDRPNREELKQLIRTIPFTKIGERYNVCDNTVRKWCKLENLPFRVKDIKIYSDEEWKLI